MNTEYFIARRILSRDKSNFSRPIVTIAIASIAIGLLVMFVAIAILTGFQREIRDKVSGFGAHIQISNYDENSSLEARPVSVHQDFLPHLKQTPGIRHIQVFATKGGIIKTKEQIQGIILKGIGRDFDPSFFAGKLTSGKLISLPDTGKSNDVMISKNLSSLLRLKLNDDIRVYFVSESNVLARKFRVCGIYETGLGEFDDVYIFCDIRHIQKLNNWKADEVSGFEILLNDFRDVDRLGKYIYQQTGFSLDARTIKQIYPQIFDWLDLQDMNVLIILVLMILVAGITMISTLLILILDRTNMIGILKALGMNNGKVRKVFLIKAVYIIGQGMFWGNLLGFVLCYIQMKTGVVKLPQESYYVSVVPVNLDLLNILLLNAGTLLVCFLMLILPSYIVTKITPVKAIRFS